MRWRTFALILLLLNAMYWAWGEGWLLPYGFGPAPQREPQRLAQQIRPQAITILSAAEGQPPAVIAAPEPTVCRQSGLLTKAQSDAVQSILQTSWPPGSWLLLEQADGQGARLRLPALNAIMQAQLPALEAALPGAVFDFCPDDEQAR
ncbi:hypothetical protein [Rhodoferax sp.]|uniref:hypothetical protein n=1 Tax=Rhodoferax sp. TaxID=50421 RepID=UPI0025F953AB|nr:hypothetical protein [Rhodoferax sp.]